MCKQSRDNVIKYKYLSLLLPCCNCCGVITRFSQMGHKVRRAETHIILHECRVARPLTNLKSDSHVYHIWDGAYTIICVTYLFPPPYHMQNTTTYHTFSRTSNSLLGVLHRRWAIQTTFLNKSCQLGRVMFAGFHKEIYDAKNIES